MALTRLFSWKSLELGAGRILIRFSICTSRDTITLSSQSFEQNLVTPFTILLWIFVYSTFILLYCNGLLISFFNHPNIKSNTQDPRNRISRRAYSSWCSDQRRAITIWFVSSSVGAKSIWKILKITTKSSTADRSLLMFLLVLHLIFLAVLWFLFLCNI